MDFFTGILIGAVTGFIGAYFVARNNMKYVAATLELKMDEIARLVVEKVSAFLKK